MKLIIFGVLLVFVVLAVWLMNSGSSGKKSGGAKPVATISTKWDEPYSLMSKDANGLYLFNYALKARLKKGTLVSQIDHRYSLDTIPKTSHPTFLFIGENFVLNDDEFDSLLVRVADGSRLFLSQHMLDRYLYKTLFDNVELTYEYGPTATFQSGKHQFHFTYRYQNDTLANKWRGFKNILTSSDQGYKVLSTLGTLENNIAIPYGKGCIYLCPDPEVFVNYQLKQNAGFYYSRTWLDRIPEDEAVYWLELGRFDELDEEDMFEDIFDEEGDGERDDSFLQFIFENPNRVIAMILLLTGVLLYVFFRAKRTQPIVPFMGKKKNMTLLFADTITSIYFSDRNPYVMLNVQKRNFYDAVQKHFFVDLSKRKDDDRMVKSLAQKSNIAEDEIVDLLKKMETTQVSAVNDHYLIEVAKQQVSFYRRTGMISAKVQEKIESREFRLHRNLWLSATLLLCGLVAIFVGFYLLVGAVGTGIILWPVGAALLTIGVLRLSKPLMRIEKDTLTYYPLLGKPKVYELSEIHAIETSRSGSTFRFNGNKKLVINYWELSRMDAQQFKRFITIQNKLKL